LNAEYAYNITVKNFQFLKNKFQNTTGGKFSTHAVLYRALVVIVIV